MWCVRISPAFHTPTPVRTLIVCNAVCVPACLTRRCVAFHARHATVSQTRVLGFMLLEQRIMLHSEDRHRLTASAEALQSLLSPFAWQHVYIPLLPFDFLAYSQAPVCG